MESAIAAAPSRTPSGCDSRPSPGAAAADAHRYAIPILYGAALVVALLLLRQPYRGVRHDAVLYLGQALSHFDPTWIAHDLYFQFGSQDSYSLFSRFFAGPVQALGIPAAEMLFLSLGRLGSLAAIYWLLESWPALQRWMALVAVACLAHFFGGRAFSDLEPFVTARTFAEPLALLSLACLLRGRHLLAGGLLLATAAAHPLIAVPTALVAWAWLIAQDRRWWWLALAAVPIIALALGGIAPFEGLLRRYDDTWFPVVAVANSGVFVSNWTVRDLTSAAVDIGLLWMAARPYRTPLARLARVACAMTVILLVVSFVAADLVHDVLLTQLQLWRVLWLSHLLSVLWLPTLVLDHWRRGGAGRLAAVAICCVVPAIEAWAYAGWGLALWMFAALWISERRTALSPSVLRLAIGATLLAGLTATLQAAWDLAYQIAMHQRGSALSHDWSIPFSLPIVTMSLASVLILAWWRGGAARGIGAALVTALLVLGVVQFDQRAPLTRRIEEAPAHPHPFQRYIRSDQTVYWEDMSLEPVWIMLRRPAFAAEGQFSGLLFNRGTALASRVRMQMLVPIAQHQQQCELLEGLMQRKDLHFQNCDVPEDAFFSLCTGPIVHADFLVTSQRYSRAPLAEWRFDPEDGTPAVTYYLHDCKTVR